MTEKEKYHGKRIMVFRKEHRGLSKLTEKAWLLRKEEITTEGKHRGVMEEYLVLGGSVRSR